MAKFVGKVKLSKQGQITLPLEARQDLNIECEDDLYWYEINGSLIITKDLMTLEQVETITKHKNTGKKRR